MDHLPIFCIIDLNILFYIFWRWLKIFYISKEKPEERKLFDMSSWKWCQRKNQHMNYWESLFFTYSLILYGHTLSIYNSQQLSAISTHEVNYSCFAHDSFSKKTFVFFHKVIEILPLSDFVEKKRKKKLNICL